MYSELHTPHKHGLAAGGRHALRHLQTRGGLAVRAPFRKWPLQVSEQDKAPRCGCRAQTRPLPQPPGRGRAAEGSARTPRPRAGSAPPAPGPRAARGEAPRGGAGRDRKTPEAPPSRRPCGRGPGSVGPRVPGPLIDSSRRSSSGQKWEQGGQAFRKLPGSQLLEELNPFSPADSAGTDHA